MSINIADELTRIINAKNIIKTKLIEFGLITDDSTINTCAEAINNITNLGNIDMTIDSETTGVHTIPAGYTNGGTISITTITHYYYNDLRLPKLPADAIDTYPYCWIRDNNQTGYYDLIMSTTSFYYDSGNSRLKHRGSDTDLWYKIPKSTVNTATSWGSPQSHSYAGWTIGSDRTAYWSNHDVTQSETSTEIYLAGSEPVPEVSSQELMTMLEEVL